MHNPDLHYLTTTWETLNTYRLPGTPRPRAALAPWIPLDPQTGTNAPVHLDTLEIMLDIQTQANDHLETIDPATTAYRMPHTLTEIDKHLTQPQTPPTWTNQVTTWAQTKAELVYTHLNGGVDGTYIHAPCPTCTTEGSLRIRTIPTRTFQEPYIVCESGVCNPPANFCSTWIKGHPAWPLQDWEGFAERIRVQEQKNKKKKPPVTTGHENPLATQSYPQA